jgi:hypothetical protein
MNAPYLRFAHWCAAQVADWDRQDTELMDALSGLEPHERKVNTDRIVEARNQIVLDKAREMGIVMS